MKPLTVTDLWHLLQQEPMGNEVWMEFPEIRVPIEDIAGMSSTAPRAWLLNRSETTGSAATVQELHDTLDLWIDTEDSLRLYEDRWIMLAALEDHADAMLALSIYHAPPGVGHELTNTQAPRLIISAMTAPKESTR